MSSIRDAVIRESEDRWRQTLGTYGLPQRRRLTALEQSNLIALGTLIVLVACIALQVALLMLR